MVVIRFGRRSMHGAALLAAVALAPVTASAQGGHDHGHAGHAPAATDDSAFADLQERGRLAMGVDQYTSTHRFEPLPDGGRIVFQREVDDAEVATIREHLQDIAQAFAAGDFRIPGFVHSVEVPGTRVMAERRDRITYRYSDRPRGGEVRIVTADPEALAAVHEFLAFQRADHRTGEP